jgi:uncharacterized protein YegP (UPF0339 family)
VHFEIYQQGSQTGSSPNNDPTGAPWRWRLMGPDGEIITSGESYVDHAACLRAVRLVRRTSDHTAIRDV